MIALAVLVGLLALASNVMTQFDDSCFISVQDFLADKKIPEAVQQLAATLDKSVDWKDAYKKFYNSFQGEPLEIDIPEVTLPDECEYVEEMANSLEVIDCIDDVDLEDPDKFEAFWSKEPLRNFMQGFLACIITKNKYVLANVATTTFDNSLNQECFNSVKDYLAENKIPEAVLKLADELENIGDWEDAYRRTFNSLELDKLKLEIPSVTRPDECEDMEELVELLKYTCECLGDVDLTHPVIFESFWSEEPLRNLLRANSVCFLTKQKNVTSVN